MVKLSGSMGKSVRCRTGLTNRKERGEEKSSDQIEEGEMGGGDSCLEDSKYETVGEPIKEKTQAKDRSAGEVGTSAVFVAARERRSGSE